MINHNRTTVPLSGSMQTRLQWDPQQMIAFDVQPWHAGTLTARLDGERIPYDLRGNTLITYKAAEALISEVVPQRGLSRWDLLSRQQGNRRTVTDAIGFILSLSAVVAILTQSGPWSARLGLGDMGRAVLILVVGLVVTLFVSEMIIGARDPRRWMFVSGMMGLFIAGAMWFIGKSMGVF